MGAAIALWDIVRKTQHLFTEAVIPLHGHFGGNLSTKIGWAIAFCIENIRV